MLAFRHLLHSAWKYMGHNNGVINKAINHHIYLYIFRKQDNILSGIITKYVDTNVLDNIQLKIRSNASIRYIGGLNRIIQTRFTDRII